VESLSEGGIANRFSHIRGAVVRRLRAVERKLNLLEKDLDEAKQADLFQKKGHILMANLHRIRRWTSSIELEDVYAGDGSTITIDLDPALPPVENAKRYLMRAKKARIGESLITSWIETARQEFDDLSELVQRLSGDVSFSQEQLQELEARYVLPVRLLRRRSATPYAAPRQYITSDGWKVFVGRSQEENDLLLRNIADREDIWLHAQGCPGAHVILHREGRRGDPPRRTLEEAAALAAYWSKARGAKTVPVIHTRVKYVRKPKGAPPGVVTVTHEKTVFVEPKLLPMLRR
jgi:predicted ribosome quality control (RQC) complex YloA/Tae2 family protein